MDTAKEVELRRPRAGLAASSSRLIRIHGLEDQCMFPSLAENINLDFSFCDREDWGANLVSDLNPAPLILFNYEGKQVYDFLYKAVPI